MDSWYLAAFVRPRSALDGVASAAGVLAGLAELPPPGAEALARVTGLEGHVHVAGGVGAVVGAAERGELERARAADLHLQVRVLVGDRVAHAVGGRHLHLAVPDVLLANPDQGLRPAGGSPGCQSQQTEAGESLQERHLSSELRMRAREQSR